MVLLAAALRLLVAVEFAFDPVVVLDAAIVRPGDGAPLEPAVLGFERLDQLGPMPQQAMLHVDRRKRRRTLSQIPRRNPD